MTTQPTYIYSDAECVLHWMKAIPSIAEEEFGEKYMQAKSTAVKFADQNAVSLILLYDLEISLIQRNTIYTVEGYEVDSEWKNTKGPCNYPCGPDDFTPDGICGEKGCCVELATLKRIDEPVVEENDGWVRVEVDLPKEPCNCIVYIPGFIDPITTSEFHPKLKKFLDNRITHWKPLPNPPKQ